MNNKYENTAPLSYYKEEIERLYFEEHLSYQRIADRYNRSREAVRLFLNKNWPDRKPGVKSRKEWRDDENRVYEKRRMESARKCVVCGKKRVVAQNRKTCSKECSAKWSKNRYQLDESIRERHKISMAKSVLKHPENYNEYMIRWANNKLDRSSDGDSV